MSAVMRQAQGRWSLILQQLGVDQAFLKNKHGPCPLCGGKDRYRFDDKDGNGTYYCNQCGPGNGMTLLMKLHGWNFKEACAEIERLIPGLDSANPRNRDSSDTRKVAEALNRIRHEAVPASDVPEVVRYLRNRGLIVPPGLQAHPNLDYWHADDNGKPYKVGSYPAMLGKVVLPSGKPVTYHRTYLSNGKKADVPGSAKKVMSKTKERKGGAIQLFEKAETLGIAEGIETAIAAHLLFDMPVWSVMHANGLMEFEVPEDVKRVVVFGDNDESFTGQMAAYTAAHRFVMRLKVEADVKIPPKTGDWNDYLLERRSAA